MFTGIVEEVGTVRRALRGKRAGSIVIAARTVLEGTRIGDSIAVNGVCLTVVALGSDEFSADVMPATLAHSNLGALSPGDAVDLERAMPADGRFGGHIVTGHIDGTGTVTEARREGNAVLLTVRADPSIMELIVERGSIAVDGVSLTVADRAPDRFTVSIIPHTGAETVLLGRRPGAVVNLENDAVGKYVRRLLLGGGVGPAGPAPAGAKRTQTKLSREFLAQNGF